MKPWDKQIHIGDSGEPLPTIEEIISKARGIENSRTRCLFVLLYLTGGRICELVRKHGYDLQPLIKDKVNKIYTYKKISNPEKDMPSVKRRNLLFQEKDGRPVILVSLRNEKNRRRKTKDIPLPLDREDTKILLDMIAPYVSSLQQEEELFPFGYQYAYKILKPYFNPHWFRHIRATHLTVKYDFPTHILRKYMGWTDDRQTARYQELRWGDILDKL